VLKVCQYVMRVHAPAKINLHLRVGPVRSDGFHSLLTWMCTVGLFDTLEIKRAGEPGVRLVIDRQQLQQSQDLKDDNVDNDAASSSRPRRGITSNGGSAPSEGGATDDVPADATNLVARAVALWSAQALVARAGAGEGPTVLADHRLAEHIRPVHAIDSDTGLTMRLTKRIPVGAGLGGGSSDAARTLGLLNALDRAQWSPTRLAELGARLGSDVPFFFHGPSSVCTGRGEVVRPVPPPRAKWAVLFLPGIAISTPVIYRQFDAMQLGRAENLDGEPDWAAWSQLPADELMPRLVNDLETPAFVVCKELSELRLRLQQNTGRVVRMSGSGSTLFTLADDEATAGDIIARSGCVGSSVRMEVVAVCPPVD
jgi:4-diphosphocytidyl-2C-methyl-D-erythritol kinase